MKKKKRKIIIDCTEGTISVSGLAGPLCKLATEDLEADLGAVAERTHTEEYNQPIQTQEAENRREQTR